MLKGPIDLTDDCLGTAIRSVLNGIGDPRLIGELPARPRVWQFLARP
jgi:hypothetical protein